MEPPELPAEIAALARRLGAPPRLYAHLQLVRQVAERLADGLVEALPEHSFDRELLVAGAAVHDLAKVWFPTEIDRTGPQHVRQGPQRLVSEGISAEVARFAETHALWNDDDLAFEDLAVAAANRIWKGERDDLLELTLATAVAERSGRGEWEAFAALDELLDDLAADAPARVAWERSRTSLPGG